MQLFSNDLGVDLGTSNVLIYADGKGLAWINNMNEGPINIARKRAMKSGM